MSKGSSVSRNATDKTRQYPFWCFFVECIFCRFGEAAFGRHLFPISYSQAIFFLHRAP